MQKWRCARKFPIPFCSPLHLKPLQTKYHLGFKKGQSIIWSNTYRCIIIPRWSNVSHCAPVSWRQHELVPDERVLIHDSINVATCDVAANLQLKETASKMHIYIIQGHLALWNVQHLNGPLKNTQYSFVNTAKRTNSSLQNKQVFPQAFQ